MGSLRRIANAASGVVLIILGLLLLQDPRGGYDLVLRLLMTTFTLYGLQMLVYFFTMARYMTGGFEILYKGVFILDAGLFVLFLDNIPRLYVMFYLLGGLALSGVIDILQANYARKLQAGNWRYQIFYGILKVLILVPALFYLDSVRSLTYIYAAGLIHTAFTCLVTAFRRTEIVYVE